MEDGSGAVSFCQGTNREGRSERERWTRIGHEPVRSRERRGLGFVLRSPEEFPMITISTFISAAVSVLVAIRFLLSLLHCVRRPGEQEAI